MGKSPCPWTDDGKYTAEIFAEDEAGNLSHLCSMLFVIAGHERRLRLYYMKCLHKLTVKTGDTVQNLWIISLWELYRREDIRLRVSYVAEITFDFPEARYLRAVVKPKCDTELPFEIESACWELYYKNDDGEDELENSGDCRDQWS